jgi:hypothetical protein
MKARVVVAALFLLLVPAAPIESGKWDHPSKMTMGELYRYKQRLAYHGLNKKFGVTVVEDGKTVFYKEGKGGKRIRCQFW